MDDEVMELLQSAAVKSYFLRLACEGCGRVMGDGPTPPVYFTPDEDDIHLYPALARVGELVLTEDPAGEVTLRATRLVEEETR